MGLLALTLPATAHAHTPIQGLGEVASGLLHPLTTPAHVLILLGLGLLIGQRQPLNLKTPLLTFVPASAMALGLTCTGWVAGVNQPLLITIAFAVGILVALDKPLPRWPTRCLFGLAAVLIGLDSRVENGGALAVFKTLLGTWISLLVVLCDVAIYGSYCTKRKWTQIGTRVLGSWIVAISMLVLAFALRKPAPP